MNLPSKLPTPPIADAFSDSQRRVLESIHSGGNLSAKNGFLERSCEFFLSPLGLRFDLAEYDFFSVWEAESYPSFRGLNFNLDQVIEQKIYAPLFLPLKQKPPLVDLRVEASLPFPLFKIDTSKTAQADLWAVKEIDAFQGLLDEGLETAINNEIRTAIMILKKTLDAGFLMLFDPFDGETHAKAFLFDQSDFFERAKDQLLTECEG